MIFSGVQGGVGVCRTLFFPSFPQAFVLIDGMCDYGMIPQGSGLVSSCFCVSGQSLLRGNILATSRWSWGRSPLMFPSPLALFIPPPLQKQCFRQTPSRRRRIALRAHGFVYISSRSAVSLYRKYAATLWHDRASQNERSGPPNPLFCSSLSPQSSAIPPFCSPGFPRSWSAAAPWRSRPRGAWACAGGPLRIWTRLRPRQCPC